MAKNVRRLPIPGRGTELDEIWNLLNFLMAAILNSGSIGNGTTAGKLRTTAIVNYRVDGKILSKASTDDLWDFTGETNLGAGVYKAYYLYIDSSGTASIAAGTTGASAALALANLPARSSTKSVFGVYVAGPNTNFSSALAAQGTIHNGLPAGVPNEPQHCTLVNP